MMEDPEDESPGEMEDSPEDDVEDMLENEEDAS
jgi:hypothetical protein